MFRLEVGEKEHIVVNILRPNDTQIHIWDHQHMPKGDVDGEDGLSLIGFEVQTWLALMELEHPCPSLGYNHFVPPGLILRRVRF